MILSIIIPVYNAAKYINQCIQSVVRQSYHDFECILIDDGSNDGSGELCDNWAGIDNRIKVIHQQNQGVSIARNKGIKIAQGKYIVFIDSDDWVEENYLEALMESNADYVISGIYIHNNNSRTEKIIPNSEITFILNSSAKNYIAQLFKRQLLFGPISKRYKLSIVKDYQIKLKDIKLEGKKRTTVKEFINGIKKEDFIGVKFE